MTSGTAPALIATAAGVGFGHAILPDHWVPLAVISRTQRYPLRRVAWLSGLAGIAHVLVSVMLGAVIIVVGLQFRSSVEHAQDTIVGVLLIATGIGFLLYELSERSRGHTHRQTGPDTVAARGGVRGLAAIIVPFGAAASPDLTILPVFLAAAAAGTGPAVESLVAFAVVTVSTIVTLTLVATVGGYQVRGEWLERWGNAITAAALLVIGGLVLFGTI